jgi:hypothetical protein
MRRTLPSSRLVQQKWAPDLGHVAQSTGVLRKIGDVLQDAGWKIHIGRFFSHRWFGNGPGSHSVVPSVSMGTPRPGSHRGRVAPSSLTCGRTWGPYSCSASSLSGVSR